jgi:enoyl-CoA hydratase/carnithine racemase
MTELVTIDVNSNGVADVRLNRPEKYNSLSQEMWDAITEAGETLMDDKSVRAIVLSGNGRGFSSGLDFTGFQGMAGSGEGFANTKRRESTGKTPGNSAQQPGMVWKYIPVPVIAAIHGVAFGAGFQIAMGADIRIAAPGSRFSVMEIKWGLIPDCSLTQTLRDLVRLDVAKELTYTGRIVECAEAAELGLVTRISDNPLESALEMAETIATKSPDAIRLGKQLFEETWHGDRDASLKLEEQFQRQLMGSKNQIEAVQSNFENRAANYSNAS